MAQCLVVAVGACLEGQAVGKPIFMSVCFKKRNEMQGQEANGVCLLRPPLAWGGGMKFIEGWH